MIEVLESVWTVAGRVPLRAKIIGIVLAATCLTGSGVLLWAESRLSRAVAEFGGQAQPFELNELLVIMLIAMTVGLTVAWLLTNVLTQQITQLTRIARQVQRGDLSPRAPVWADDEIGQLATTLNAMIHSLSQSQVTLEIANERLGQRNEELSALWAELKQRDAARARLLANAVTAQEQERERISRELHDETGQALTALLVQLKVLERLRDEQAILAHAETLRQLVLGTLEEVRRLARDLRPGMLDELGLVPTLEWHIRGFARNAGLPVDFEARVSDGFRLPVHTELALYRVVQEALTNIVRHADATSACVRLDESAGLLRLTVTDDGRGFDVAAAMNAEERGVGLLGIQERVELIGGVLALDSSPGYGARLSVEVPLPERMVAL